ncbi:bifunctional helix-turn-helix domain-containing protein/methylated-DNA--[protein]-cysteine S-methyltransferase [Pedobacter nutrimenti]|jgi:AraC family transcriptional regulator of adaptative response/methylated-DNA-[protein]-cysteine methyltransferase|uniref:methylated-DNA--[protein]-cysteine S-methyltransferase n=1 Tax=Pedobacter nutrimenti TaxID=1241337 RepID=A0A318UC04_9SPHI|nr:methylated-DNA--[protein]-cysteine S-methyltransferase [Pedobacter nutrimenti]PYF71482.1 AraC family transcriptional regulator of adaptative response/methylated-DNA-[protein]-cysteine methyltransferase [Pedobacter nutrimenti]
MNTQDSINYNRVAQAIAYIKTNFKQQPDLEEIAREVHLSPFHFQRLFTQWAGVSPKKFIQYLSVDYAKNILKDRGATLFDAAYETGLSGTGRLHDLFIHIEGMTPGEYKNGGEELSINYSFADSTFGKIIIASTSKGICHMAFVEEEALALSQLKEIFPNAAYQQFVDALQISALQVFSKEEVSLDKIKLHLKGTPFQLKVWEALLKIPTGKLVTYATIAENIEHQKASRAVGTAIGNNPVAFLIPCHRVIQSTGAFGGYHWGLTRKSAMIAWEAAQTAGK